MSSPEKDSDPVAAGEPPQSFLSHLGELRDRLLRAVLSVLLVFASLCWFSSDIYSVFAAPLMERMPAGTTMIATEVTSPFVTPLKLTLLVSIFICVPYLLYQGWAFIAPGLYRREQLLVLPLVLSSTILFYVGVAFSYFLVLPLLFAFLSLAAPQGITIMTDINHYLSFCSKMFLAFGFSFEVPIAAFLVVRMGIVSADTLRRQRALLILAAFICGMLLTPPDIISQLMLALPIWLLFEIGLLLATHFPARSRDTEGTNPDEPRIHRSRPDSEEDT